MQTYSRCTSSCLVLVAFALLSGCASVAEKNDDKKIVIDGEKYVTVGPAVGSHMSKRVKISDLSKPGISPTRKDIITAETDVTMVPPTSGEMERAIAGDRPTGN